MLENFEIKASGLQLIVWCFLEVVAVSHIARPPFFHNLPSFHSILWLLILMKYNFGLCNLINLFPLPIHLWRWLIYDMLIEGVVDYVWLVLPNYIKCIKHIQGIVHSPLNILKIYSLYGKLDEENMFYIAELFIEFQNFVGNLRSCSHWPLSNLFKNCPRKED